MNNMEKEDKIVVEINGEEKIIYPLMDIERELKKYLVYTTSTKDIVNNICIGQLVGDSIIPVDTDEFKYFDDIVANIIANINNG